MKGSGDVPQEELGPPPMLELEEAEGEVVDVRPTRLKCESGLKCDSELLCLEELVVLNCVGDGAAKKASGEIGRSFSGWLSREKGRVLVRLPML